MKHIFNFAAVLLLLSISFACEEKPIDTGGGDPPIDTIPEIPKYPATGVIAAMGLRDGITRISDDSLAFVLFAPKKQTVHLIGSFTNWKILDEYKMEPDSDRFWIKIGDLIFTEEYVCQYLIDKSIRIADPYCYKTSDENDRYITSDIYPDLISYPTGRTIGVVMAVSTKQEPYNWKIQNFTPAEPAKLNIYELLIRDFTKQSSIKAVTEKLPYLKELGINAVELMPFNEFEGNDSWGYNPSFYFAPDKAYGTPNDYKEFIDACHENGMAVIMDMVLNHSYGQSPLVRMYMEGGKPSPDNPWYNVDAPNTAYSWGYDFNHESPHTQAFVDSVCAYWMKEYKIDGYRFDFTKGFTNKKGDGGSYDASRISILKRMADEIWKRKPNALVILEHFADNSEEKILANYGMMIWGNLNHNSMQMAMGWSDQSNISGASYKQRGWEKPHLVAYMESHDEERMMYKNIQWGNANTSLGYNIKDTITGLKRNEAAAVIFLSIPGPKMIWQFGELGYDYSINSRAGSTTISNDNRVARKEIRWDYYDDSNRRNLYNVYADMCNLRINHPAFSTTDFSIDVAGMFKTVTLKSSSATVVTMANFDVVEKEKTVNFSQTGVWKDYFSDDILNLDAVQKQITLQPGEYRLYFRE